MTGAAEDWKKIIQVNLTVENGHHSTTIYSNRRLTSDTYIRREQDV